MYPDIKPNIPRLKRAVEVLKNVAERNRPFDLGSWATHKTQKEPKDEWCGTTACACGYFAMDEELSSQGLKLKLLVLKKTNIVSAYPIVGSIQELNTFVHDDSLVVRDTTLVYGDFSNFSAAAKFFGIHRSTADYFFCKKSYSFDEPPTVESVIKRMETYISEHENAA
jgi:hypothetical protein